MRAEIDCEPEGKYLSTNRVISDSVIEIIKNICITRYDPENKKLGNAEAHNRFINWHRKDNEIALYTSYAYADFQVPKEFNCIFEQENPNNFVITNFKLTQSILEAICPMDSIEDGFRHVVILEFEEAIPKIMELLYVAEEGSVNPPRESTILGICQSADFEAIKTRILWRIENE